MRNLGLTLLGLLAPVVLAACTTSAPESPPEERIGFAASALENCTDGVDNDLDGLNDCVDPSCSANAACATQIPCDGDVLNVRDNLGILWRIDTTTPNLARQDLQTLLSGHNALGYNLEDGFYYLVRTTDLHLVRLSRNPLGIPGPFDVTDLGAVPGLSSSFNFSAGFDTSGNYWSSNGGTQLIKIDVSVNPLTAQTVNLNGSLTGSDMAFDPDHNRFYSVNGNSLESLDMVTLNVTTTTITGAQAAGPHGTQWFDVDGFMYVISNTSGLIRQVDVTTGVAILVGSVTTPPTPNDGAACAFAAPPFEFCNNGLDDDGDGVTDENANSAGGNNCITIRDTDGDGVPNVDDLDDDNDGIPDVLEPGDTDGDGRPDRLDLDSDNDGIDDNVEAGHAGLDANSDGIVDGPYGLNGLANSVETAAESAVINYTLDDSDLDGTPDFKEHDSDNDGVDDVDEAGLSALDADNDGDVDASADDDNDGIQDGADGNTGVFGDAVGVPLPDADNDGTPDFQDSDADNDGVPDLLDNCDFVANSGQTNTDGDAQGDVCDTDDDNDGVLDVVDNCSLIVNAGQANNDGDAQGDVCDTDDDNDGVLDVVDNCSLIANSGQENLDGDAQGDVCDTDDDNDGLTDAAEGNLGSNPLDADSDDDGVADGAEPLPGGDADGDGIDNILDSDSDNDGLFDGTELGLGCGGPGTNAGAGQCIPDADNGQTTTNPQDADSDDGGISDGAEDANHNGVIDPGEGNRNDPSDDDSDGDGLNDALELSLGSDPLDADSDDDGVTDGQEPAFDQDSDGDGLLDLLDPDSDNDGLFDGTELGLDCSNPATNLGAGSCTPDADAGATTTDPLDADTDDGGVEDGSEDANANGALDAGETDPTSGQGADDGGAANVDTDGDGLSDAAELTLGSNPNDADTDDDGVSDGAEINPANDTDGDGLINVLDTDSDNDGLFDGTELGLGCAGPGTDASQGHCVGDADAGATTTSPVDPDSDDGGVSDGSEDFDHNGAVDSGEGDPNDPTDDATLTDTDGDGLSDGFELVLGTQVNDADTDDDGVIDGAEPNPADDTDGDGFINALDEDSDGDGLFDGTELGFDCSNPATNLGAGHCTPDADGGATTTLSLDADTDDGGISDGAEDANHDGAIDGGEGDPNDATDDVLDPDTDDDGVDDADELTNGTDPLDADSDDDGVLDGAEPSALEDTDNDGTINALDSDSDDDGILDGTELGLDCSNPDTDPAVCVADADDGATTTDPLDDDSDDGTVPDGTEDANHNGQIDDGETDPNLAADDVPVADSDGDGLTDDLETALGSDPLDADSDDDGVLDGQEPSAGEDTDDDGLINVLDPDSDDDGLFDGTELGLDCSNPATDPAAGNCTPDADSGATTTDPLDADTDDGSVSDGDEDTNLNGQVDAGERDPNVASDDLPAAPPGDDGLFPEGNGILCSMGSGPAETSGTALGVLLAGAVLVTARRRSRKAARKAA